MVSTPTPKARRPLLSMSLDEHAANDLIFLDPKNRQIGEANLDNIHQALSTLAIFPFTSRLGMSIEAVRALVTSACVDAANPALKAYFPL